MLVLNGLVRNLHVLERKYYIKEKAGDFSFSLSVKYELWNELVKNFHLEASYLSAIMDNPADIFIANFHPYNEFIAILHRIILRPSGEPETIFIVRAIAPSLIGVPLEVLIQKVEL